jgi:phosphoenolpyruvate-protein kinase (PTS system EI component)
LRAIAAVDPPGAARVLLPMVTEVDELLQVREWLAEAARSLGRPMPALGVMIETPSSALLAGQLALTADFLSIGTNDLSQYALAMDRGHPELASRLDALHPAVLRLIAAAAQGARQHGRSLSVCGALAADDDALPILVGLGVRELSVPAGGIPKIKRRIRELQLAACEALAAQACALTSASAVRALVRASIATTAVPTPQ